MLTGSEGGPACRTIGRSSRRHNGAMNRSADWLHQAQADLELAGVSAAAGHHEWACFAFHQAGGEGPEGFVAAPCPFDR